MYKSQRLSLSYPAIERLKQVYGLPADVPSQTLAGYVEQMIFEHLASPIQTPTSKPDPTPAPNPTPNLSKLAAMATKRL